MDGYIYIYTFLIFLLPKINSFLTQSTTRLTHLIRRQEECLICLIPMLSESIFMRVDTCRSNAQLRTSSHDSRGNFSTISSKDFLEWWCKRRRIMFIILHNHLSALEAYVACIFRVGGIILSDGYRGEWCKKMSGRSCLANSTAWLEMANELP